jgi:hypothetical protein
MRVIFLYHQGLGDHIVMNGLVHSFLKGNQSTLEELCIVARDHYCRKSLEHLYSDFPIVTFHWMTPSRDKEDPVYEQLNQKPIGTLVTYNGKEYMGINFGFHSVYYFLNVRKMPEHLSWVDYLYDYPFRLSSILRFTEFHLPSNLSVAQQKYEDFLKVVGPNGYVIVHDEPNRNRTIDRNVITPLLIQDNMLDLPVIYLGLNRYSQPLIEGLNNKDLSKVLENESLLDLYYILKNASACHLMCSSVACLVDCVDIQCKLYMHSYLFEGGGTSFVRSPWVRIVRVA